MFKLDWDGEKVINAAGKALEKTSKEIAEDIEKDAKEILKRKAETTTEKGLLSQFDVRKSRFNDGSYIVWSQGPGNWRPPYHASFLELGTYKDEAKAYMRPALRKNKSRARKKYQHELDKL